MCYRPQCAALLNVQRGVCCWGATLASALLVGPLMLSHSTLWDQTCVNQTSPNEENSPGSLVDVSGLETSKNMKCQDFYTETLDDLLYIFSSFPNISQIYARGQVTVNSVTLCLSWQPTYAPHKRTGVIHADRALTATHRGRSVVMQV